MLRIWQDSVIRIFSCNLVLIALYKLPLLITERIQQRFYDKPLSVRFSKQRAVIGDFIDLDLDRSNFLAQGQKKLTLA